MVGLFALAAASMTQCSIERAHYVLRHNPDVTAHFRTIHSGPDWPSGLALAVHHKSSGKTFWWLPWAGGTDGLQNVASTQDVTKPGWRPPSPNGGPRPYGNRQYVGTDAATFSAGGSTEARWLPLICCSRTPRVHMTRSLR